MTGSVWAGGAHQDFQLTNATGYTIDQVYVSPSSEESWESDVLGRDILNDGEYVNIHFERDTTPCKWDLKVVYTDNEAVVWHDIDLCTVSAVTIHWDRSSGVSRATVE
ncbi:MAG: hypothetical protein HQL80_10210 [Magnetococcales bacterium]|nr:hypothetical protein [Magnetococcales bacterium]